MYKARSEAPGSQGATTSALKALPTPEGLPESISQFRSIRITAMDKRERRNELQLSWWHPVSASRRPEKADARRGVCGLIPRCDNPKSRRRTARAVLTERCSHGPKEAW